MKKVWIFVTLLGVMACKPVSENKNSNGNGLAKLPALPAVTISKPNNDSTKWPVLLFFDAQARGAQFVKRFATPLSDVGVGVVASNRWKNGINGEKSQKIVNKMLQEAAANGADMQQIYVAGFSGGAHLVRMLSQSARAVKGVITMGAGNPQKTPGQIPEVMVTGMSDFNFRDVMQYPMSEHYGKPDLCMVFDGGHEWAPTEVFVAAVKWCMQPGKKLSAISAEQKLQQLNRYFLYKSLKHSENQVFMSVNKAVQQTFVDLKKEFEAEQKWQNILRTNFVNNNKAFWLEKLQELDSSDKSNYFRERVREYMSLLQFMAIDNYIREQQFLKAEQRLAIYRAIDPENPDVEFLAAKILLYKGEYDQAMKKLSKALKKGYDNFQVLRNSEFSEKLANREDFILTLKRIYPN